MTASNGYLWGAILLLLLCSLITRSGLLLFGHRLPLGPGVRRALAYAPVAALVAIIVPEAWPWQGDVPTWPDARLVALIVGAAVMWRTRSAPLTMVVGMVVLWGLQWLMRGV